MTVRDTNDATVGRRPLPANARAWGGGEDGRVQGPIELFAVASFGGHFEQLLQLREAWAGRRCLFVTTRRDTIEELCGEDVAFVQDCHTGQVLKAVRCLLQLARLFRRHRPKALVTTGALPGLLAVAAGRLTGARVIWIDSVANAHELSTSGRVARGLAHVHLSQWPDVAAREHSKYAGSVL